MKKILIAFDGSHFSKGAFEFARMLNEKTPILLTAAFLPNIYYANLWSYAGSINDPGFIPLIEGEQEEAVSKNIKHFESLCIANHIEFRIHKDFEDLAVTGLKSETRFADLLLLGSQSFYKNIGTSEPNVYLQESLHRVECPVLVLPEEYDFPKTNILAYDGTEHAVFAIKQFAYIFPELACNPTLLVFANKHADKKLPDEQNIEELADRHYRDLTISNLDIDPAKEFVSWMSNKKGALLVCGAFGRSGISLAFKKSFISNVIAEHHFPVFISHR